MQEILSRSRACDKDVANPLLTEAEKARKECATAVGQARRCTATPKPGKGGKGKKA